MMFGSEPKEELRAKREDSSVQVDVCSPIQSGENLPASCNQRCNTVCAKLQIKPVVKMKSQRKRTYFK